MKSVVTIFSFAISFALFATEVTDDQAAKAVANWLKHDPTLGTGLKGRVALSRTCLAADGETKFHVVTLAKGGYVVTSGDTEESPFLLFSDDGDLEESDENPLWELMRKDCAARAAARKGGSALNARLSFASGSGGAVTASSVNRWSRWLNETIDENGVTTTLEYGSQTNRIDDLCVPTLTKTRWAQGRVTTAGGDSKLCYNYYTPSNYVCGCVATAMSQLMRYHCWPTNPIPQNTYACSVNGTRTSLTLQGGYYDWAQMEPVPNGVVSNVLQRQVIGKLTSDAGISVQMDYAKDGSAASSILGAQRLKDLWGYPDTTFIRFNSSFQYSLGRLKDLIMPCVAAGLPLITGLDGHCVLTDGYGYSDGEFYIHLNMGWGSANSNAWYLPADIDDFESGVLGVAVNSSPSSCPSIFSGRVKAEDGTPLGGIDVFATDAGGKSYRTKANKYGVYAFTVEPGSYSVSVSNAYRSAANGATTVTSVGNGTASGGYVSKECTIGNVRSVDLVFAATPAASRTIDLNGGTADWSAVSTDNYCDESFENGVTVANGTVNFASTRYFRPEGALTISNAVFRLPDSSSVGQLNFNTQPGEVALRLEAGSTFYAGSSRNTSYIGNDGATSTGRIEVVEGSTFVHTNADFALARTRGNGWLTGSDSKLDFGSRAIYLDYNGGGKAKIALTNCNLTAWSIRIGDGEAVNANSSALLEFQGGTNDVGVISCATADGMTIVPKVQVVFNGTTLRATRDIGDILSDGGATNGTVFVVGEKGLVIDTCGYDVGLSGRLTGSGVVTIRGGATFTPDASVKQGVTFVYDDSNVITVDPPIDPILISNDIRRGETYFKLATDYCNCTCGRFVLATVKGSVLSGNNELAIGDDARFLFDASSVAGSVKVTVESSPAGSDYVQVALEVGDWANAPALKVMTIGDSITHRSSAYKSGDAATGANYRLALMDLLAAKGYRVSTVGFWNDSDYRRTQLAGPEEYGRHMAFAGEQIVTSPTQSTNAGLRESLDNLLDSLDDAPDVITLMIGTNDINTDYKAADVAPIVTAWSNLVVKLTRRYPSAQVIASGIIEMPTNYVARNANAMDFNARIKAVVDGGAFKASQVKMIDLRAVLPRTVEDYLGESNLHPNWQGQAKLAKAWSEAIVAARAGELPSGTAPAVTETSGATANVSASYRSEFEHLLTLRLSKSGRKSSGDVYEVVYSNAAFRASTPLRRVGYYLELKRTDQSNRRFVWADMDAWGEDRTAGGMGFPMNVSYQGYAANLHVASNVGAVHAIAPSVKDKRALVQFTYRSVATDSLADLTAGFAGWYDWNDSYLSGTWGLMNVNRVFDEGDETDVAAAEVLFSCNGWNRDVTKLPINEIGIGNCALNSNVTGYKSLNYIMTGKDTATLDRMNAAAYAPDQGGEMLLEIWGVLKRPFAIVVR